MGIIDILKGIERLAVEILLWLIYIPKTIFKIIKDPNWVTDYVHEELSKDDKFKTYMSPVLLFLGVSVVLFVLLDSGTLTSPNLAQKSIPIKDRMQDAVGLLFLGIPLFFALFTEFFRNGSLKKEALMQNLYVQCYYLSPVMLSLFVYLIADQFDWEVDGDFINVSESPLYLFLLTLLWFIIVQVKHISRELRYNKIISLGIVFVWFIILGVGYASYFAFVPEVVNNDEVGGEIESISLTLPKDDEYSIQVYNYSYASDSLDLEDYSISVLNYNAKTSFVKKGFNLIHNQTLTGTIEDSQLRFMFSGTKGDQVTISLTNFVFADQMKLALWTKSASDNLLFDDQGALTDIWTYEISEETVFANIILSLPETGDYHLLLSEVTNYYEEYRVGFYKHDYFGATDDESIGLISYNIPFMAKTFNEYYIQYNWKFKGKSGDEIIISLDPIATNDLAFDVLDSTGKSIVPADKTLLAQLIHWVYVIFFGYVIFIGFRAFFRKSKHIAVINENTGTKLGKIVAIFALVVTGLAIVLLLIGL